MQNCIIRNKEWSIKLETISKFWNILVGNLASLKCIEVSKINLIEVPLCLLSIGKSIWYKVNEEKNIGIEILSSCLRQPKYDRNYNWIVKVNAK